MELIKRVVEDIMKQFARARMMWLGAASAALSFTCLWMLKRRKTNVEPSDEPKGKLSRGQIDFINNHMIKRGINYQSSSTNDMSFRTKMRRQKLFEMNNLVKKFEKQKQILGKNDQMFFNIMTKFGMFVVKNKFAFA